MLDVVLRNVSFAYREGFALRNIDLLVRGGSCVSIAGLGSSTLLKLISGDLKASDGDVLIGTRSVAKLRRARRPLLYVGREIDAPGRWSVRHALVAAVRQRTLDRIDRQREYDLAVDKWRLQNFADRRLDALSDSERALTHLAAIELRKPGILVADRPLAGCNVETSRWAGEEFYRMLRVIGATVIVAPSSPIELGWADTVVVLEGGAIVQAGRPAQVFTAPLRDASAHATGDVNVIPISIRGNVVHSVIGEWDLPAPPFQGSGVALVRPDDFEIAPRGEESHLIFNIEEAAFQEGRWLCTGILSGAFLLRVVLPRSAQIEKGRLLPLRYDASRFPLIQRDIAFPERAAPTDVVPPMRETR